MNELQTKSGFIAIVGPANAGKSTLLNALLGTKLSIVSHKPQTTRDRIFGILTEGKTQLVFIDTPGFVRGAKKGALAGYLRQNIAEAAEDLDIVVLCIDACSLTKDAPAALERLQRELIGNLSKPNIICLTKVDAIEKQQLLPMIAAIIQLFPEKTPEIVPISVHDNDGVELLKNLLLAQVPEGPFFFPEGVLSDKQPDFVLKEVVREKLLQQLDAEVPHSAAVFIESITRSAKTVHIDATIFVEKESQKAIVIGKGGKRIKEIGTAARIEIESMLAEKVCLNLRAVVEKDWTKSSRGLARVGYGAQ